MSNDRNRTLLLFSRVKLTLIRIHTRSRAFLFTLNLPQNCSSIRCSLIFKAAINKSFSYPCFYNCDPAIRAMKYWHFWYYGVKFIEVLALNTKARPAFGSRKKQGGNIFGSSWFRRGNVIQFLKHTNKRTVNTLHDIVSRFYAKLRCIHNNPFRRGNEWGKS